jgi:hypothetical protein
MAKKMTKAQVKKTLTSIDKLFGKLLSDKFNYGSDSLVPMSTKNLIDKAIPIQRIRQRFK